MDQFLQAVLESLNNNIVFFLLGILIIISISDGLLFFIFKKMKIDGVNLKNSSSVFFSYTLFAIILFKTLDFMVRFFVASDLVYYATLTISFLSFSFIIFKIIFEHKYYIFDNKLILKLFSLITIIEFILLLTFLNIAVLFFSR